VRAGRPIRRIALAYEAGRDGFLAGRAGSLLAGIEGAMSSIRRAFAVSRERKRAKTDRLDAAMLMRVFLGWLRGERGHCGMVAIPDDGGGGCEAPEPRGREKPLSTSVSRIVKPHEECAFARSRDPGIQAHILRKAPERPGRVCEPRRARACRANIIEEFRRDMARPGIGP